MPLNYSAQHGRWHFRLSPVQLQINSQQQQKQQKHKRPQNKRKEEKNRSFVTRASVCLLFFLFTLHLIPFWWCFKKPFMCVIWMKLTNKSGQWNIFSFLINVKWKGKNGNQSQNFNRTHNINTLTHSPDTHYIYHLVFTIYRRL